MSMTTSGSSWKLVVSVCHQFGLPLAFGEILVLGGCRVRWSAHERPMSPATLQAPRPGPRQHGAFLLRI